MIRASGLYGRAVIDLDTAERVGEIEEIIVDPYGPGIAGYVVSCDRSMFGSRKRIIVPIDAVHAIGPDAVTMRSVGAPDYHTAHLDALPRLSELTGRRMVSFGGRFLGAVEDALISERDGRIIGYPLERPGPGSWLESVFGLGWRAERPDYVRADAALRIGARLIVVPDDAIAAGSDLEEAAIEDLAHVERPALASAPPDTRGKDDEPVLTAAAVRESRATTSPFSMDEILTPDERAERAERSPDVDGVASDYDRPPVDPEEDTGLIAAAGAERARSRRRPQAERMR
jgi:sporulation protein YlmC with PRC-barrel domain